jgi:hypothetical protein
MGNPSRARWLGFQQSSSVFCDCAYCLLAIIKKRQCILSKNICTQFFYYVISQVGAWFNIWVTLTLHHFFWIFTDVTAVVPSAGLNYFCCDTCSSLRWQVSFNLTSGQFFWHAQFRKNQMVSPCYLFLLPYPTVCEWSMLQYVLTWQNHPWSGLFLHEWQSGGGKSEGGGALSGFLLAVVECSHHDRYQLSIYSALYIRYEVTCPSYPFVHSMSNSYYSIKIRCLAGYTGLSNILFRFLSLNPFYVHFHHLA